MQSYAMATPPFDERLLTVPEVAGRLGIADRTAWEYVRDGQIKSVKLGRLRRVREGDLRVFIAALGE